MPSRSRRIWAVAAHIVPHHQERASSASKVACTGAAVNLHAAAHAAVPMVDVSPFLSYRRSKLADTGNGSISAAAQDVVDQVGRACRAVGFIVVTGHGIDPSLTRSCADEAARFFRQPEGAKLQVAAKGGAFGYIPLNSEALGDDGDATSRPDLREAFAMGPIENLRPTLDSARLSVHDREVLNFCYQPTPWPDAYVYADELPTARRSSTSAGLQPAMENMYLATARLGDGLLRIFGHALGIDEALLLSKTTHHFSAMAAINYPPVTNRQTLQPGQLRCGPHQDSGTLTIVWESAEGLEVLPRGSSTWVSVRCPANFRAAPNVAVDIGRHSWLLESCFCGRIFRAGDLSTQWLDC